MKKPLNPITDRPAAATQQGRSYQLGLVQDTAMLQAVQALRFEVFNLELDEGLVQSYDTGLDADAYDAVCDHLVVLDSRDGTVVGTYRLQTGVRAQRSLGYYSEREFDFSPFEAERERIVELGRACIHRAHRNFAVLNLLWKGIASYAQQRGARYLLGCSSITSQDPADGAAAFRQLSRHLAPPAWRTRPVPSMACAIDHLAPQSVAIPRLLSAYLALGAAICGEPAIDREFRTIDFLTWIDIQSPAIRAMQARGRFIS